ncbi:MAG TPA: beta-ketoacyl synthase chain length factor, partial [Cyclobacteriaceae bacterium]|nr:beta-ketoacyl synthase chain length factor [Cyclobacteriaceae bacterium]
HNFFQGMSAFIHGMGLISAQDTFNQVSVENVIQHSANKLVCIEPDYTPWIDAKTMRRMSKIIRMGVAAAKLALQQAKLEKPDSIITGTGLGCLEDTEVFLNRLINNREEALNPTPFIQSTHNTIGSQIALLTQCRSYNQTYTQRAFSFELALQDALMMLKENPTQNILAGSADEVTDLSMKVFDKFGWVTSQIQHGEGAGFFLLNTESKNAMAELSEVSMLFKPKRASEVANSIQEMISKAGLDKNDIDLVLTGECGDLHYDSLLKKVCNEMRFGNRCIPYKKLCGEYSTSSAFAVWLAGTILSVRGMPKPGMLTQKPVRNVLIYNQYFNQHHTLIMLKTC